MMFLWELFKGFPLKAGRIKEDGMTQRDGIRAMGRSKEEDYFRRLEREAIERLRKEEARKAERAAMGEIIDSQDPKLLAKLEDLGFNHETVKLLHLLPLVQTAWADNRVDPREMALILYLSRERGVMPGSSPEHVLTEWLRQRPADKLFRDGLELISEILCSRPAEVRRKATKEIVELCARVAAASGGLFGLGEKTSNDERRVINKLRERIEVPKESAGPPLN
jgi:hypothetical protein